MKNTLDKPHQIKYLEKYRDNFLGLIAIPSSIIILIVGMYGQVFDRSFKAFSTGKYSTERSKSFYPITFADSIYGYWGEEVDTTANIFLDVLATLENQINKQDSSYKVDIGKRIEEVQRHNHLIIIDRTLSADSYEKKGYDKIIDFIGNKSKKDDMRNVFINHYCDKVTKHSKTQNIFIAFYNGIPGKEMEYFTYSKDTIGWIEIYPENKLISVEEGVVAKRREDVLEAIQQNEMVVRHHKQKTDITRMFQEVAFLCDHMRKGDESEKIIVSIISDFDHEESTAISEDDIEKMQQMSNKPHQFNIIYLPVRNAVKKHKSDQLVKFLYRKIHGAQQLITIDITEYNDSTINEDKKKQFTQDLIRSVHSEKKSSGVIPVYLVGTDHGTEKGVAYLKFENTDTDSIYWRVSHHLIQDKPVLQLGKYKTGKIETNLINNQRWHKIAVKDTLVIEFGLNPELPLQNLQLEVISGDHSVWYSMRFIEYFPPIMCQLLKHSIVAFLLLSLIFFIISVLTASFNLYRKKEELETKIPKYSFRSHYTNCAVFSGFTFIFVIIYPHIRFLLYETFLGYLLVQAIVLLLICSIVSGYIVMVMSSHINRIFMKIWATLTSIFLLGWIYNRTVDQAVKEEKIIQYISGEIIILFIILPLLVLFITDGKAIVKRIEILIKKIKNYHFPQWTVKDIINYLLLLFVIIIPIILLSFLFKDLNLYIGFLAVFIIVELFYYIGLSRLISLYKQKLEHEKK